MIRLTKSACMENLNPMMDLVLEYIAGAIPLSSGESNVIRILCEEILVNIIRYACPKTGDMTVEVECDTKKQELKLCFIDSGTAFDPLKREEPDIIADADERLIGGLGIFMVRRLADSVEYERSGDLNKLTIRKTCVPF